MASNRHFDTLILSLKKLEDRVRINHGSVRALYVQDWITDITIWGSPHSPQFRAWIQNQADTSSDRIYAGYLRSLL